MYFFATSQIVFFFTFTENKNLKCYWNVKAEIRFYTNLIFEPNVLVLKGKTKAEVELKFTLILLTNYCMNGVASSLLHSVSWKMDETKVMLRWGAHSLLHVGRDWWRVSLQFKPRLIEDFNLDPNFTSSNHAWLVSWADSPISSPVRSCVTP